MFLSRTTNRGHPRPQIGYLLTLVMSLTLTLAWGGPLPSLWNANAPGRVLADARTTLEARASLRQTAMEAAAVLDGARGDFEQRGLALRELSVTDRAAAAATLAADARLLERLAASASAEREALRSYDNTLMASTRDLGPGGEALRPATWPIVELLKLYPPPVGLRSDWWPPDAVFFARGAAQLEAAGLEAQVAAATEIGRSTYSLRQLLDLDTRYRSELDRYAALLNAQRATPPPAPGVGRLALAATLTVLFAALFSYSIATMLDRRRAAVMLIGLGALALWYLPAMLPLALLGAVLLTVLIACRPALAAVLPLASVPFYYRPRTVGPFAFPLTETLIVIIILALTFRGSYHQIHWFRSGRAKYREFLRHERWLLLAGGGLLLAGVVSVFAPTVADLRTASREFRRTLLEPLLWAIVTLVLMRRKLVHPSDLLWALIIPATWVASDGLVRWALGRGSVILEGTPRLIGILPSATALGAYLGTALAAALALALAAASAKTRFSAAILSVPLLAATVLTFTRGAWIGVLLSVVTVLLARRAWKILGLLTTTASLGLGMISVVAPSFVLNVLRIGEGTAIGRVPIWIAAWNAIRSSPVLGLGLDQLAHVDPSRYGMPQQRLMTIAHPHNLVLDVWLQLGLLGVVVITGLVLRSAQSLWPARHHPVALATLAILVDLLVHGMVDQTLMGGDMIYIWWLVFIVATEYRCNTASQHPVLSEACDSLPATRECVGVSSA